MSKSFLYDHYNIVDHSYVKKQNVQLSKIIRNYIVCESSSDGVAEQPWAVSVGDKKKKSGPDVSHQTNEWWRWLPYSTWPGGLTYTKSQQLFGRQLFYKLVWLATISINALLSRVDFFGPPFTTAFKRPPSELYLFVISYFRVVYAVSWMTFLPSSKL